MRDCIVTPTFKGHFNFIKKYLESFDKFVEDKSSVRVCFIIDKEEFSEFKVIIEPYKDTCNIEVLFFDDVLIKIIFIYPLRIYLLNTEDFHFRH